MQVEKLPRFSENMESATVVRPLVSEGDEVQPGTPGSVPGTPLFEMVTDKAEFEYESTISGRVIAVLAGERDEVPVGYALMVTGTKEELPQVDAVREENRRIIEAFHPGGVDIAAPASAAPSVNVAQAGKKVRATPAARRLAKNKNIELATVKEALGIDGIVREEHVTEYITKKGGAE